MAQFAYTGVKVCMNKTSNGSPNQTPDLVINSLKRSSDLAPNSDNYLRSQDLRSCQLSCMCFAISRCHSLIAQIYYV